MKWDYVAGNWRQIKGSVRERLGKFTDDKLIIRNARRDQLLGQILGIEDATDAGGDRADGLELPEVEALVKPSPFELDPELPVPEPQTRGGDDRFVELLRFEKVEAPAGDVAGERDLAPALGGVLDLA